SGEFAVVDETKLSANTLRRYRQTVLHWTAERDARLKTIAELGGLVAALEAQLGEEPTAAGGGAGGACAFERINGLRARFARLSRVGDERAGQMETLRREVGALYELMQTVAAERIAVAADDLSRRALDALERERGRLQALKAAKMGQLVAAASA